MNLVWMFWAAFHLWRFRNDNFAWFSMCTEHSSVTMTSLKLFLSSRLLMAKSSRFTLLGSWISWQYFVPVCTQPSFFANPFDFTLRKVVMELFVDLLAKMGHSKLVISLHFGIYEVQHFKVTCSAGLPAVGVFSKDCRS